MGKSLEQLRAEIDQLDDQIIELLNQRASLAVDIGHIKKQDGTALYVPSRERSVLNRLMAKNKGPLSHRSLCRIYREIMASSLALEHRDFIIAGGADKQLLAHAVHFLAGVNADTELCDTVEVLLSAYESRPDALLVVTDEWRVQLTGMLSKAAAPVIWFGCWTIVSPENGEALKFHILGRSHDHVATSRPAVVYCLLNHRDIDRMIDAQWLAHVPSHSFEFTPLINQPEQGILKINLQASAADIRAEWSDQLSRHTSAVWIV